MKIPLMLSRIAAAGFDPTILQGKTACIFGVGGLGAIVAEMLVRTGIGTLILVDRDIVGPENLNRLGYSSEDLGLPKVTALARKLEELAKVRGKEFPLKIETYFNDVIAWEELPKVITKCDIIFTCFDNLEARLEVNYWAVKYRKPIVDGGTSENGLRGRVIVVIPKQTPCLGCYFDSDTLYSLSGDEDNETGSCNASLPTTMAIVASFQVDQGIRILLSKSPVVSRLNINLDDDITVTVIRDLKPRTDCKYCGDLGEEERNCRQ